MKQPLPLSQAITSHSYSKEGQNSALTGIMILYELGKYHKD